MILSEESEGERKKREDAHQPPAYISTEQFASLLRQRQGIKQKDPIDSQDIKLTNRALYHIIDEASADDLSYVVHKVHQDGYAIPPKWINRIARRAAAKERGFICAVFGDRLMRMYDDNKKVPSIWRTAAVALFIMEIAGFSAGKYWISIHNKRLEEEIQEVQKKNELLNFFRDACAKAPDCRKQVPSSLLPNNSPTQLIPSSLKK